MFFLILLFSSVSAFVNYQSVIVARSSVPFFNKRSALNVIGPKQAASLEKRKNPKKYDATIKGLMKTQKLSQEKAEQRFGEYLVDPDGFALNAAANERREKGYKDWIDQAVTKSNDPEATQKRIDDFTSRNRTKGVAIMAVLSFSILYYSYTNPYVPIVN